MTLRDGDIHHGKNMAIAPLPKFIERLLRLTIMFLSNQELKIPLALGIGVGLIFLAFLPPGIFNIDGNAMLELSQSLVTNHNFRVSPETGALGRDGYYYSRWYPLLPVLAVPFVAIGLGLSQPLGLPGYYVAAVCALVLSALLIAGTTSLVALLALRLGGNSKSASLAALSFAFGTIALVYGRSFFAEPILAFLTAASLYFGFGRTKKEIIAASIFAGLAVVAKPPGAIVGSILSVYLLIKKRPLSTVFLPLIGTIVFAMIYGLYNYACFGNPLSFGQSWMSNVPSQIISSASSTKRSSVMGEGILGLLISPGRGLFWYCPPVIVALVGFRNALKKKALEAMTIATMFLGLLVIYSGVWWDGGAAWGPRYLLPVLPGLLALTGLVEKQWRKRLLILTLIGFFINAPTIPSFYERYYVEANEQGISKKELLWSPGHSALVQGWGVAYRQISDARNSNVKDLLKQAGRHQTRGPMLHLVSVWWWMLPVAGIPRWFGAALAFVLMGIGIWVIRVGTLTTS